MNVPMTIPYFDERESQAVREVLNSGWLIQGRKVEELEKLYCEWTGAKYAVACGNCTEALHMALLALGIGIGDKVLVPAYTFVATANAVEYTGATPVFMDVDLRTFNATWKYAASAMARVGKFIRAIIPVHLFGLCADMPHIISGADQQGLDIVEDAACALGSTSPSGNAGSILGCFSWLTRVMTSTGRTRIKDIKVGDRVLTGSGTFEEVTNLFHRSYVGTWYKVMLQTRVRNPGWSVEQVSMTAEHPVRVYRDGIRQWIVAAEMRDTDWVYVPSGKCKICGRSIPAYWVLCEYCNPAEDEAVRQKISDGKNTGKAHVVGRFRHYYEDILPYAEQLERQGFKVIPIGVAVPDITAIKDGRVTAYEIENRSVPRRKKEQKYSRNGTSRFYDEVVWVTQGKKKNKRKATSVYVVEDDGLVRVPITGIKQYTRLHPATVYNLEVSGDHTYYAGGILVHNCFSMHPRKSITTGEGGMLTTDDEEIYLKAHALRDFGFTITNLERHNKGATIMPDVEMLGYNYRLTDIQAAIGVEQMKKFTWILAEKQRRAKIYDTELGKLGWLQTPYIPEGYIHTYQSYAIILGDKYEGLTVEYIDKWGEVRNGLMEELKGKGVATRQGTHAVHIIGYYAKKYGLKPTDFMNTYAADKIALTIPLYPQMGDDAQQYVIDCMKEFKV